VTARNDGIYLNGIKIINQKAVLQIEIFKILIRHYMNDILNATSTYITISQIASSPEIQKICSDDYENQIRVAIHSIRVFIRANCKCNDSIIESRKWMGYRLGSNVFLERF
jgi:hypothetical protein